jgi:curved DNA-binding protein CbpA
MAPKVAKRGSGGGAGDTKGAYLSTRYMPSAQSHMKQPTAAKPVHGQPSLYELLGVAQDCEPAELKTAYREKALTEHPDKGGDQERFDAIYAAFNLLQDPDRRLEYDEDLAAAASSARLVVGAPETRSTGEGVAHKKTAPTVGSKRQKDWHKQTEEWAGEKSGSTVLKNITLAITDAAGPMSQKPPEELLKDQTEALFKKYQELGSIGKEGKQKWVNSLTPKQKQALKSYAKAEEAKQKDKAQKWLGKS